MGDNREQMETCEIVGHVWRQLIGGKVCDRCFAQRYEPEIVGRPLPPAFYEMPTIKVQRVVHGPFDHTRNCTSAGCND